MSSAIVPHSQTICTGSRAPTLVIACTGMVADSSGLGRQLTLHMLVLAQVDLLQTPRMMVAHISHCRAGKTSGRSASYHLNGGTLCWHRRGRTGETTCAASSRQLGTEDAPSSLAWRHRASRTGCNLGLRCLEIAVMWGLAHCGTDPSSNVGGSIRHR